MLPDALERAIANTRNVAVEKFILTAGIVLRVRVQRKAGQVAQRVRQRGQRLEPEVEHSLT